MIDTHTLYMSVAHSDKKDDLIVALCDLASRDEDFNGNNGDEYLWDIAKEMGFKTNMEYVASISKGEDDIYNLITCFMEHWLGQDDYYDSYDYDYTCLPSGEIVIAVSYSHEC